MSYSERFNYGKIKDDFNCPNDKGYYSSTHTSFDSKFNQIPSLEDLEEEYPNKLKTFRWGKGNQFFATYGIGNFGELELLDTNWYDSMPMGNKELKEENERLKKYIDYLKEKIDNLKKTNKKISKENKENEKKNLKKNKENERKAEAFDKLCKLLYSKLIYHKNYQDIYGNFKGGPVKVGQYLEGESVDLTKLTDKETVKLLNLLLMGMGSEYYIEWFGYTGLDDKDDKEEKATIRE